MQNELLTNVSLEFLFQDRCDKKTFSNRNQGKLSNPRQVTAIFKMSRSLEIVPEYVTPDELNKENIESEAKFYEWRLIV